MGIFWMEPPPCQVQGGVFERKALMSFASCRFDWRVSSFFFWKAELSLPFRGKGLGYIMCVHWTAMKNAFGSKWSKWCLVPGESMCPIYRCNISRYTCQEGQDKCKSRFFSHQVWLWQGHHRYHGWIQRSCAIYFQVVYTDVYMGALLKPCIRGIIHSLKLTVRPCKSIVGRLLCWGKLLVLGRVIHHSSKPRQREVFGPCAASALPVGLDETYHPGSTRRSVGGNPPPCHVEGWTAQNVGLETQNPS